jgi:hypothetical protein
MIDRSLYLRCWAWHSQARLGRGDLLGGPACVAALFGTAYGMLYQKRTDHNEGCRCPIESYDFSPRLAAKYLISSDGSVASCSILS